jgi:hypothetical protein
MVETGFKHISMFVLNEDMSKYTFPSLSYGL